MSAGRDELATVIHDAQWTDGRKFYRSDRQLADTILAAGYRKPRTITSRVDQVNLPNGTVVETNGDVFQHFNGYWFAPGSSYNHHLDELSLPLTVVHEVQP